MRALPPPAASTRGLNVPNTERGRAILSTCKSKGRGHSYLIFEATWISFRAYAQREFSPIILWILVLTHVCIAAFPLEIMLHDYHQLQLYLYIKIAWYLETITWLLSGIVLLIVLELRTIFFFFFSGRVREQRHYWSHWTVTFSVHTKLYLYNKRASAKLKYKKPAQIFPETNYPRTHENKKTCPSHDRQKHRAQRRWSVMIAFAHAILDRFFLLLLKYIFFSLFF